ncbi:MAG: hypothetical protein ABI363_05060 [Nitrosospira sp.]
MKVSKDRVEAESIALSIHLDGGQFHERNQFLAREQFAGCRPAFDRLPLNGRGAALVPRWAESDGKLLLAIHRHD